MKMRVLYHLVRADFLERVRRYSFLVTLAAATYLGYCCETGKVVIRLDEYRGVYNSAWLGCLMALVSTTFLTLIGFYIVKNAVQRDQETRVGQILATTPMTKSFYTMGKTISNFVVLAAMIGVMALAAVLMQWLRAEDPHVDLWALLSPFLLFALPAMAFTAALAVLFDTLPILRGGAGNIIYFFVWTALLAVPISSMDKGGRPNEATYFLDLTGVASVMGNMQTALRSIDPEYKSGAALTFGDTATSKQFLWEGLRLSPSAYLSRATCLLMALGVALVAAMFFHRFDPAREWGLERAQMEIADQANGEAAVAALPAQAPVHLTPLLRAASGPSLPRLVLAELKLMLKGQRWWWYAVAGGVFVASIAAPLDAVRGGVAIAVLIWPVLVWSRMGTREARFNTASLIFSSERSLQRQLPAVWIAGVVVTAVTNGGLAIRLVITGDRSGLLAWLACTLFVPSLALALGIWSGTSKAFEACYTVWWYVGPAHKTPGLDFLGASPESARPHLFLFLTAALVVAAYLGRRAKLTYV
jgi:hypothetical protein